MRQERVLGLFRLERCAGLRTRATDTRAVLGWRDGLLCCAFRGTQTLANVVSDIKA